MTFLAARTDPGQGFSEFLQTTRAEMAKRRANDRAVGRSEVQHRLVVDSKYLMLEHILGAREQAAGICASLPLRSNGMTYVHTAVRHPQKWHRREVSPYNVHLDTTHVGTAAAETAAGAGRKQREKKRVFRAHHHHSRGGQSTH